METQDKNNVLREISSCTEENITPEKAERILQKSEIKAWIHGESHQRTEDILCALNCIFIVLEKIIDPKVIGLFESYDLEKIYNLEFDETSEAGEEMMHIIHELSKNPAISERIQYALMNIALKYHDRHLGYNLLENKGCNTQFHEILAKEIKDSHM